MEASEAIKVNILPSKYRTVFPFNTFNRVQSKCYNICFESSDNIVLVAPTGCGKTVIAEMGMISALLRASKPPLMIYVSPLRSLCQEKVRTWEQSLRTAGVAVQEYTGDSSYSFPSSISAPLLLCTTPEKLDLATRTWKKRHDIFSQIALIIVDEVHILGESRGSVLEAMLSRILHISDFYQMKHSASPIRIIALSATIPNYRDLSTWLRVPKENIEKTVFGEEYRSTTLVTRVFGYTASQNDWMFESSLTTRVASIIRQFAENKPAMVFCCTRKSCEKTAMRLIVDFPEYRSLSIDTSSIKDKSLSTCLRGGVGFHTAGLCPSDRAAVESLFARGGIRIICTTSTLAQGINLPAHTVIVKGTKHYNDGSLQEYDPHQIIQMLGRAGRPQFHDEGVGVIMTEKSNIKRYEAIVNSNLPVESSLMTGLREHLNSEIAQETILDESDALHWLKSTFLYIRLPQNPLHYKVGNVRNVENFLQTLCSETIQFLNRKKFICRGPGESIKPLPKGILCSQYGVMIDTINMFYESDPPQCMRDVLDVVSKSYEFLDMAVRQEEKTKLKLMAADPVIRWLPSDELIPSTKVHLLVQIAVGHGKIDDWTFGQEFPRLKRTFDRLLGCFSRLMVDRDSLSGTMYSLLLQKCVNQQMWETETERLSQQIKGLGEVYARKIGASGYTTFNSLRSIQCHQIERITGHRPGWGVPVIDEISKVPKYELILRHNGPDIDIVVRNESHSDPSDMFHSASVLVGIPETDKLLLFAPIKRVLGHMNTTLKVEVPAGVNRSNIKGYIIDSKFVGIDIIDGVSISGDIQKMSLQEPPTRVLALCPEAMDGEAEVVWTIDEEEIVSDTKPIPKAVREASIGDDFWEAIEFEDSDT